MSDAADPRRSELDTQALHHNVRHAINAMAMAASLLGCQSTAFAAESVWLEDFERLPIGQHWLGMQDAAVTAGCGVNASNCLRVAYRPNRTWGETGSPVIWAAQPLPPAREYTLNYDLLFENDFEFVRGGKLPGLAPARWSSGCRAIAPEQWSVRLMWRAEGRLQLYTYHQDREDPCGDQDYAAAFGFERNRYYAVSLHVRLNTDGDTADGVEELFVDGASVAQRKAVRLRGAAGAATLINTMLFNTFFGGTNRPFQSWYPSTTVHARFDNFAVYAGTRIRAKPGS